MTAATRLLRPLPHVPKSKHETQYSHRRQVEVLRVVGDYIACHHYPPTLREIARGLGCRSTTPVVPALRALSDKGIVAWECYQSRTLRIIYGRKGA